MSISILSRPVEINTRLEELGLTEEILRDAVEAGERVRRTCTPNHPRLTAGLIAWSETVKILRDRLMPLGWSKKDEAGVPIVIHPDGSMAIAVTTGRGGSRFKSWVVHIRVYRTSNQSSGGRMNLRIIGTVEVSLATIREIFDIIEPTSRFTDHDDDRPNVLLGAGVGWIKFRMKEEAVYD